MPNEIIIGCRNRLKQYLQMHVLLVLVKLNKDVHIGLSGHGYRMLLLAKVVLLKFE